MTAFATINAYQGLLYEGFMTTFVTINAYPGSLYDGFLAKITDSTLTLKHRLIKILALIKSICMLKSTSNSYTIYNLNFMENILVFDKLILSIHRSLLFEKRILRIYLF